MPPVLERLGPFDLVKNLTRPGRAEVYLGRRNKDREGDLGSGVKNLPEQAVIKVLRPPENVEPALQSRVQEAMARFIEEGRLGTRLRHPAITRNYGVGFDSRTNLHFIIQEYVEGITLAQVLEYCASREQKLPPSVLLRMVIPILKAIHYAHHDALREDGRPLRVVHRDIKPANVMLAYDGRVLLLDLAAAKSTSFSRQDTVQDVIMGTSHYLAPEQVFDVDRVGHATDVFAAGVILYELATLTPLLPRTRRLSEIAGALARFNFASHQDQIDEKLYPGVRQILTRALDPDPNNRWKTAGDMARELDGLLLHAGDGPGLSQLANELRRQWDLGTIPSEEAIEERQRSGETRKNNLAPADTSPPPARPEEAQNRGPGAQLSGDKRPALASNRSQSRALSPPGGPPGKPAPASRSAVDLALAAVLVLVVASVTWLLLDSWM